MLSNSPATDFVKTVTALVHRVTLECILSLVRGAGFINCVAIVNVLESPVRTSSAATLTVGFTVDQVLWTESDFREFVVPLNGYSITNRRGNSMSPATSTVLRDVLVPLLTQVVDSVHVSPIDIFRHLLVTKPWKCIFIR